MFTKFSRLLALTEIRNSKKIKNKFYIGPICNLIQKCLDLPTKRLPLGHTLTVGSPNTSFPLWYTTERWRRRRYLVQMRLVSMQVRCCANRGMLGRALIPLLMLMFRRRGYRGSGGGEVGVRGAFEWFLLFNEEGRSGKFPMIRDKSPLICETACLLGVCSTGGTVPRLKVNENIYSGQSSSRQI